MWAAAGDVDQIGRVVGTYEAKVHARRDWATCAFVGNIPSDSDGSCRYFAASGPRRLLSGRRPVAFNKHMSTVSVWRRLV